MKSVGFTHIIFDHDGTLIDTSTAPREIYQGVRELLSELSDLGVKLYVWTARDRASTIESLESFNILHFFEALCCSTDTVRKPNPEGPKQMFGEDFCDKWCMIGDSFSDMQGAKNLGAYGVGAMWAHGVDSVSLALKQNGADNCFLSVRECHEFLIKN